MKLDYPATGRNGVVIQEVLERVLPRSGHVLEVASGSGQHALRFAAAFPTLTWQPSDPEDEARGSIDAYQADAELENLRPALLLDAAAPDTWPIDHADVIYCANMIHIAPWATAEGLVMGAKRILSPGGLLLLYGPYRRAGVETALSNERFDESLRGRNPAWGLRNLEDVVTLAAPELELEEVVEMPANNLSVMFRKQA